MPKELTFYNSTGDPVAYTEDGEYIYLFSGEPVAYLQEGSLWDYDGHHLGRFEEGWIRDNKGNCVFFTDIAQGGPLKPLKSLMPLKSLKNLKSLKGLKELRPLRPLKSSTWSDLSNIQFFYSKGQ